MHASILGDKTVVFSQSLKVREKRAETNNLNAVKKSLILAYCNESIVEL